jgi:hypothetical protein
MSASKLLNRVGGVEKTGLGRWVACSRAHNDRSPEGFRAEQVAQTAAPNPSPTLARKPPTLPAVALQCTAWGMAAAMRETKP